MEEILDAGQAEIIAMSYAGFWIRLLAAIIDGILISIVQAIITFILFGVGQLKMEMWGTYSTAMIFIYYIVITLINWIYYAGMESSAGQATLGKKTVGIKVTDLHGERISFGRATGRYFSKFLSAIILCIGFLMVAFSPRKQGLHDRIADTLVLRK